MNLDQIASRIADPASCTGAEISALKELTVKYPYAQVFSILYLKALANQNDIGFDEALQKHAYRISDRMKLYDLIHDQPEAETETADAPEQMEMPVVEQPAAMPEPLTEVETKEPTPVETVEEETPVETVEEETPIPEPVAEPILETPEEIIEEPVLETEPESIPETEEVEVPEAEAEIEIETPTTEVDGDEPVEAPEKEHPAEEFIPDFVEDDVELEIISQVVATVYNDNLEHSIPEKPVEEKKSEPLATPVPASEEVAIASKRSFSSWLKAGNQAAAAPSKPAVEENLEELEKVEKQIDKIINKFIEEEPTISRPKKEFYSPTKKAKESISSESMIYTETLAGIFAMQGNFPKAIVAYEQLILTNPEKKIFFAQRIKELKEKLNT